MSQAMRVIKPIGVALLPCASDDPADDGSNHDPQCECGEWDLLF
jgi:hypothetical protein